MQLLAAVVDHTSVSTLREITPELLEGNEDTELRVYRYIRDHHEEFRSLPTRSIIRENTGIQLPDIDREQPPAYYLRRCRSRAVTRHLIDPYNRLQEALAEASSRGGEIEEAVEAMYGVVNRFARQGTGTELSETVLERVMEDTLERRMSGGIVRGITTGWTPLDATMDGYNPQDLVVWVGRPGRGKSWLLLNQTYHAWVAGYKPLYISMEMGAEQNMRRILGIHSRVNPSLIRKGQIGTLALPYLRRACDELFALRPMPMVTANFSRTVDQIANFVDEHTPDIVFIDAGYLLSPKKKRYGSSGRRETISDVIEELKELANNTNLPFVITVQFNRNAEQRRRGSNTRRREGGQQENFDPLAHLSLAEIGETDVIGQAASHVLGIEFPPYPVPQNRHRVFGFLKGREGESGWWVTNYMQTQHSAVDMSIVAPDDPVYDLIRRGSQNARGAPPGQRSAMMRLQDRRPQ